MSDKLKVGEREYPVVMNATRSHVERLEDCSGSCRPKAGTLNRKFTQGFMEVQIEKEWIWWTEEKGEVATASGKTATVPREGEAVVEDGLWIWTESWRSEPSRRRGRDSGFQLSQDLQWEEDRSGSATPAVQRGSVPRRFFFVKEVCEGRKSATATHVEQ